MNSDTQAALLRDLIQHACEVSDHTPQSFSNGVVRLANRARALQGPAGTLPAGGEPDSITLITTPTTAYTWIATAADVVRFSQLGQGHTIRTYYAAPQPAQEPLTEAQVGALEGLHPGITLQQAMTVVRAAEAAHGIKPKD